MMSEQGAGADSTVVDEASGPAMAGDTSENCTSTSAVDVAHDAGLEDAPDSFDALDDEGASEDKDTEDVGTSRRAALARGAREKLASLDMTDMRSSFGGTAKQAYSGVRTFFANHETVAVLIGMACAFLLVCIAFAIVYSFVIKGATIARDNLPEHLSNQLTPVENHELPHLSLRVLDITTDSYPTVRAKIEAVPEGESELPALDAASFDVEACDAEDAPIEATIESVEAGKRAGEYTITFAVEAGEDGAKQRIMLSLVPESGYRGGANIGFYTPSSRSDDA
ncbi:hypothetical protein [uncultured Enorma sp.]|uniref:hypothetical protein n=1 Tax=uncultured Enorma sp. TaxID=1714346 RepID=UPI002632F827|nr:hypothetical protein [uncultured Enorma sp.]